MEQLSLQTDDGARIAARLFVPEGKPVAAVLIAAAMGVSQSFYEPFADWFSRRGVLALTFDYRGIGRSRIGSLRKVRADVVTWAREDAATALGALATRAGALPLTWVGHSLGGQVVPLVPNQSRASKLITVAAGSGYWRDTSPQIRRVVPLLWFLLVPLLTPLFGYFPGKRLNLVGDIPRNVIWQWRRWCLHRDYLVGVEPGLREIFAGFQTPITSLSFSDDEMMSEKSISSLHSFYSGASKSMRRFAPGELGVKRIGHFGFFRPEQEPLWEQLIVPELAQPG